MTIENDDNSPPVSLRPLSPEMERAKQVLAVFTAIRQQIGSELGDAGDSFAFELTKLVFKTD